MHESHNKIRVGILGATGMVGQKFLILLENHPWFEVSCVAASPQSAGKSYVEATKGRWSQNESIPGKVGEYTVYSVEHDAKKIASEVEFVFSAIDADKEYIKLIEEKYASLGIPVVSNNSAHRWTEDVPKLGLLDSAR